MFKRPLSPIAEEGLDPRPAKRARLEPLRPVEFCASDQSLEPHTTDEPQDAKTQISRTLHHLQQTKYPDLVWFAEYKLKGHIFDFGGELNDHKFAVQVGEVKFDHKVDTLNNICQSSFVHLLRLSCEVKLDDYESLISEFVTGVLKLTKAKTLIRQIGDLFSEPSLIAVKSGKHKCSQCSYRTDNSGYLKVHMRIHTGEKPFKCEYLNCEKAFTSSGDRTKHMRIHTGEKPFKCKYPECGQAFTTSGNLTIHMRFHTGDKPFKCDYLACGQTFATSGERITHMRIHTGEKPFKCDFHECDQAFAQNGALTVHKRFHTGDKPFKCDYLACGQTFATSGERITHMRIHTGEKPFKCEYPNCEKVFTQRGHLIVHMRIHTGQKPFQCDFSNCDQAFAQSGHLKTHKTRWHTERGIQKRKIQEEKIHKFLEKNEVHFDREPIIDFKCAFGQDREKTCAKIDFVFQRDGHVICLEIDEREHSTGYQLSCELRRMADIHASLTINHGELKSLTFIRYNPDAFTIDEETQKVSTKQRQAKLLDLIQNYQPIKPFEIIYMYYSSHTVQAKQTTEDNDEKSENVLFLPDIYDMPDFDGNMKPFVQCIVE